MAVDVTLLNSNSLANITTNFERIEAALQDTVGRSGTVPNQMAADIDLDSNDLLNVNRIDAQEIYMDGSPIVSIPDIAAALLIADDLAIVADNIVDIQNAEENAIIAAAAAVSTAADVVTTNANVILTNADAASTSADALATAADRVQTGLDRVQTGLDRIAASDSAAEAAASAASTDLPDVPVALNYIRRNAANLAYENRTPAEVATDIGVPTVTPWVTYTPTFTNLGTVTAISIWSRRVGDTLQIRGKFTTGTTIGAEARMTLGFNGVDGVITSDATKVPSIQLAGGGVLSISAATSVHTLIESAVGYITFGFQSGTTPGISKLNGTSFGNGTTVSIQAELPITGW